MKSSEQNHQQISIASSTSDDPVRVALEHRLRECRNVVTLGVRPNFTDYTEAEAQLIRSASKIYYPSIHYADIFDAIGKKTFPSYHTYKFAQDKIKQTAIFELAEIPHPKTRIFYGKRWRERVTEWFDFPFIAKIPRGSALGRGVFLIENPEDMESYCDRSPGVAYLQEYLPLDRDIRIVIIGKRAVHAYWRIAKEGEFRSNIGAGGRVSLEPVPDAAIRLALHTASRCRWDDVGIDICSFEGNYYVLEGNMKYGKEGLRAAGIDYSKLMESLVAGGEI